MLKKIDASNKNMKETTLKFFGSFVKELKEFKYINLLLLYKIKEWKETEEINKALEKN